MKVKLTLGEILNLDIELSGYVNPENGEQILSGLLSQKLSLITKFKLTELRDLIAPLKKNVEDLKNDMIKSKGEEKDGTVSIPMMIDEVVNPVFIEFQEEYSKLLSEEKELEISELKIEDFDIVTNESYNTFFKIIKAQQ
jgi:hypothetical protein